MNKFKNMSAVFAILCALALLFGCAAPKDSQSTSSAAVSVQSQAQSLLSGYNGEPYCVINGNVPNFTESEITDKSFESYSPLDSLGRCGVAVASVGTDIMPTEDRGSIGQVKPAGWHLVKYDIVDGKYLYNRCHLIGFQLTGENANEQNLITGTRYLNVTGMLPFENDVAEYVKKTNNHVMYRVTPVYDGDNLIADGVQMEAYSVEDGGKGLSFNVFCYNVQPGIVIDYATGDSYLSGDGDNSSESPKSVTYIVNKSTKKFHLPACDSVADIKPENRVNYSGERQKLIDTGYTPCSKCNP